MKRTKNQIINRAHMLDIRYDDFFLDWTKKEDNILKEFYKKEGKEIIKRFPNRKYFQVMQRVHDLKLIFEDYWWSKEEDDIIKLYYEKEGKDIIERLPNRSLSQIYSRALALNIKCNKYLYTDEEILMIKQYYPIGGINEVRKHININKSDDTIRAKALALGLHSPNSKSKKVLCLETGIVYASAAEAIEINKCEAIDSCLRGKCYTANSCHWVYEQDFLDSQLSIDTFIKHIEQNRKLGSAKRVICLETNIIYESAAKAAKDINLNSDSVANCCRGKRQTAGGYHWKYV